MQEITVTIQAAYAEKKLILQPLDSRSVLRFPECSIPPFSPCLKAAQKHFFFFALFSLPFRIEFKVFKWAADPSEVSPKQVFFRAFVAKLQLDFFWYQFYDFQNDQSIRNFLQKMISVVGIPEVISSEFSLEGSANILCKASITRSSKPVYCKSPVIILTAWGTWGTFHINGASFCYIHVGNRKSFTFVNGWDTGKSVFHQAEGHGALGHN